MAAGDGLKNFKWSPTNPNDAIGGCGCLCSELKSKDRGGPYKVFTGDVEMENPLSPRPVLCSPCAGSYDGEELTQVGEVTVEGQAELVSVTLQPNPHVNPVAEGHYPNLDALSDDDDELAI